MKLLALILAFAAYADLTHAQPTVVDGDAVWRMLATKTDGHMAHARYRVYAPEGTAPATISVTGCTTGYRLIAMTVNKVQKVYEWQWDNHSAINLIATDICKQVAR